MSSAVTPEPQKKSKALLYISGITIAVLAMGSGVFFTEKVYKPQTEIVQNLEQIVSAPPATDRELYADVASIEYQKDPFFESKEWKDYYSLVEERDAIRVEQDTKTLAAQADGVWLPGLSERAEEAVNKYGNRNDNLDFTHFRLAVTATTNACEIAGHVHFAGMTEEQHDPLAHAAARKQTREFVQTWKMDEEPMSFIATYGVPDANDDEQEIIKTAFTKAMETGIPYFCGD